MPVVIALAVLLVGAGAWAVHRRTEPGIMRRRINAGSDRHFAERAARQGASEEGVDFAADGADDGDD